MFSLHVSCLNLAVCSGFACLGIKKILTLCIVAIQETSELIFMFSGIYVGGYRPIFDYCETVTSSCFISASKNWPKLFSLYALFSFYSRCSDLTTTSVVAIDPGFSMTNFALWAMITNESRTFLRIRSISYSRKADRGLSTFSCWAMTVLSISLVIYLSACSGRQVVSSLTSIW